MSDKSVPQQQRVCISCTNPNERTLAKQKKERDTTEILSRIEAFQALYRVHSDVVAQREVLICAPVYLPVDDQLVDNHAEYTASDTGSDLRKLVKPSVAVVQIEGNLSNYCV